jgi:hypothetical protein
VPVLQSHAASSTVLPHEVSLLSRLQASSRGCKYHDAIAILTRQTTITILVPIHYSQRCSRFKSLTDNRMSISVAQSPLGDSGVLCTSSWDCHNRMRTEFFVVRTKHKLGRSCQNRGLPPCSSSHCNLNTHGLEGVGVVWRRVLVCSSEAKLMKNLSMRNC